MKKLFISLTGLMLLFTISCGKDDPKPKNNAPDDFTVTPGNIGTTTADLVWTAPADDDGDDVSYEIKFDNATPISVAAVATGTIITFGVSGLTAETAYTGIVTADDGNDGTTDASFSFTTQSEAVRN